MKEKYCQQEDLKEELEGFATQELGKVKHMVSAVSADRLLAHEKCERGAV